MANANFLNQIRQHMEKLQNEYSALAEAYKILAASGGETSSVLSSISSSPSIGQNKGPRKRGRPPGARNKAGYKKPGPKPQAAAPTPTAKPVAVKSAPPKKKGVKRGRKPGASKKNATKAAAKASAKPAPAAKSKKNARPAAKKGKRTRVPNLSGMIQDVIGKSNRFMVNSSITDKIAPNYPDKTRSDLGKYISVILSIMKSKKQLGVVTVDQKGNKMRSGLWGLPSWFDGNTPKAEYLK